jgi:hypothetical protein
MNILLPQSLQSRTNGTKKVRPPAVTLTSNVKKVVPAAHCPDISIFFIVTPGPLGISKNEIPAASPGLLDVRTAVAGM